ncbi:MAG: PAS domain S-box-containing protein [Patiriisocius sp.]|jgi:PAS domain S-box-containing protein
MISYGLHGISRWMLSACIAVLPVSVAAADPETIRFNHLSREQGLSQSFISSVVQDKNGYMWFGSQGGLNRFDGYEVTVFARSDAPDSLPDNSVRTLLADSKGRLWIGTDKGGLSRYHVQTESFTTYDSSNSELPTDRIRVLHEDSIGQIWVGTDGAGLWRFDPEMNRFEEANAKLSDAAVWSMSSGMKGELWLGTRKGLFRLTLDKKLVPAFAGEVIGEKLSGLQIRSVHYEPNGDVWVGTEAEGAFCISPDGTFQHFLPKGDGGNVISGRQVSKIFQDDRGDIWLGTSGGLDHFSGGQIQSHRTDASNPHSLSNDVVLDVFQDQGGVMWVGGFGGLNYWARSEYFAKRVSANPRLVSSLSSPAVVAFAESRDGTVWVGTYGGGLNQIMPGGLIRHHRADAADPVAIPDDSVMSLLVDSKDRLWVGTRSMGLVIFDPDAGVLQRLHADGAEPRLTSNAITSITESIRGELVVGTYGGGINRINLSTFEVTSLQAGTELGDLQSDRIMTIHEDSVGRTWIGTDGAGLAFYDVKTGIFQHFQQDIVSGFSGDFVLSITEDSRGNLYFGTLGSGVFLLAAGGSNGQPLKFRQISERNGLVSNNVFGLLTDNEDLIWLSSSGGLTRLNPESGAVYHLGIHNNLQDLEFNSGAALRLASGDLLFGGVNGFNIIVPSEVETNTKPAPVMITSVVKQGQQFSPASLKDNGVELSHRDYSLEFRFAGLDYADAKRNQYRYRLIGFDESWVEAETRRYASYTNLEPGNYVFEVVAANSDGVWGQIPAQLKVSVMAAPWLSWWAYLCYALAFVLVIFLTVRAYRSRLEHIEEVRTINQRLRLEVEFRKEKEAEVNLEREKSQRYLDVAEVALVALDVEGLVLHVNEKASTTFGSGQAPFVGANLIDFVAVQHRNDLRQKILAVFDGEDAGEHIECEMRDAKAGSRTILWRFAELSKSAGHASMILASGTDISELRHLEKSVRFREKLSALGTLSAGIAHDFNNILTAITGYSTLALEQVRGQGEVEDFVRRIESASTRATELVARILSVSQIDEKQFETLDPSSVIHDAVGLLKGGMPSEISIEESYPLERILVNGDANQIRQLVMNLGTNAATAMEGDRGVLKVAVSTADLSSDELPAGTNLTAGPHVIVDVIDTGKGIAESLQQRIFDPFYSSDGFGFGERVGTGLGLSIVHGIVLAHKGHIELESKVGRGTRFRLHFPVAEATQNPKVLHLTTVRNKKHSIMLVDDEEWAVDVAARLLTSLGHKVQPFTHPVDAMEQFKATPEAYDVVIIDQNMPQIKGTELIDALREVRGDIKILLMSGNVSPLRQVDGATQFLAKPFKLEVLKSSLAALGIADEVHSVGKRSS